MPRACVIVLDAVGAGELPDAAEYGDEGSDTLGNVARAVGGLDLPNLEALGLGNVEPLEGCPPQPGAPAVAGRLVERSKGKDTTTGHWELMGIVTPEPMPTYPHGFPFEVIEQFAHRTGRGVLGNKAASGTEIIQELGEEHQKTGQVDRLHVGRLRLPDRGARGDDPARGAVRRVRRSAREILTGPHAVGRVIARPFVGEPGNYARTPNRHDCSLQPPQPNYLDARARGRRRPSTASGRSATSSRAQDIDESLPDEVERRGHREDRGAPGRARRGPRLREPRRDGHALGPPQRPGELPPLPAGLRPAAARPARGAARRRPARPHLRPRLRPDDAVDRPLARARAAPRLRRRAGTRAGGSTRASSPTSARP